MTQPDDRDLPRDAGRPAPPQDASRIGLFAGIGLVVLVLAGAGGVLALRGGAPATGGSSPSDAAPSPGSASAEPGPAGSADSPPGPPARQVRAIWVGEVKRAEGVELAPGAACVINAVIRAAGPKFQSSSVEVHCGAKTLYRSTDAMVGTSRYGAFVEALPGAAPGQYRYALGHDDTGEREGERSQATIASLARTASVWSDNDPKFRVEIALEEESAPSSEPPLVEAHATVAVPTRTPIERRGKVSAATGEPPAPAGAPCKVRVRGSLGSERLNCRVVVECAGTALYGGGKFGFAHCEGSDGVGIKARDADPTSKGGDPKLDLDLDADRVVVEDDGYALTIALDPGSRR